MSLGSDFVSYGDLKELDFFFFELFKYQDEIELESLKGRYQKYFLLNNFEGTIYFLKELDFISLSKNILKPKNTKNWPKKEKKNLDLLQRIVDVLKKNNEINLFFHDDLLKFESNEIVLEIVKISSNFRALRDLFIDLNFIKVRPNSKFHLLDEQVVKRISESVNLPKKRKVSQAVIEARLEAQKKSGEKAELWVLEFEREKFKKSKIKKNLLQKISKISNENASAGYDLESFIDKTSTKIDKFIEVKSFSGTPRFFWTPNELSTSRDLKDNYYLYIVDMNKIDEEDYVPMEIKNPAETILEGKKIEYDFIYESSNGRFTMKPDSWKVEINKE